MHSSLKLDCKSCHPGASKGERAGFPSSSFCRGCHQNLAPGLEKFPAQRHFRAADFVVFSHARHTGPAKIQCRSCHGAVGEKETWEAGFEHTMKACVDCHRERKAVNTCTACHELGQ